MNLLTNPSDHRHCPAEIHLGPADLAADSGDRSVVGHVLRLERAHAQAEVGEQAAQPRRQHRLAHVRAAALNHQRGQTIPSIINPAAARA
jgi:hypothetical protein